MTVRGPLREGRARATKAGQPSGLRMTASIHDTCANTLRALAIDAVEAADSGHVGMPMGMADVATVLWTKFLRVDPADPLWPDRDRFVLSAGHGSMLLYGLLHMAGFPLTIDDLKAFRQWGSRTPGHPEFGHTVGVETTTGPLGQGFANGVGMAIAERLLRDTFGAELCDHHVYAIVSDGDVQEGISHEAAAIAGHLGLGRLVYLFDDNQITIDGATSLSTSEDPCARMASYGWHTDKVDGHDPAAIEAAITRAKADPRPSFIACRTIIGKGSPSFQGTSRTHGAPLGKEECRKVKIELGMDPDQFFVVPQEAVAAFRAGPGPAARQEWVARSAAHARIAEFQEWIDGDGRALSEKVAWPAFTVGKAMATRKTSQACLDAITKAAGWVIGGSADLAGSNGTEVKRPPFTKASFANAGVLHFGIREHGMAAICNGIALHRGARPYAATFLVFHDYMRPSVRLSALMGLPVTWIYTHDSIFLGEDGPTHQPVETLLALRAIPALRVYRPADGAETVVCWKMTLELSDGPSVLVLSRQNLPEYDHEKLGSAEGARRGLYVLSCSSSDNRPEGVPAGAPQVVLIGTGSEVEACMIAQKELGARGIRARVVSAPCRELFLREGPTFRESVLPAGVPRLAVEAGVSLGWEPFVGETGAVIGLDHFGASAPAKILAEQFGFTPRHIADVAAGMVAQG